jgi:hypothetical protein
LGRTRAIGKHYGVTRDLSKFQVQNYLKQAGGSVRKLRAALGNDPFFWELLETPLMLWVAI